MITWEFTGGANSEAMAAANAASLAMENHGVDRLTKEVAVEAATMLGEGWDADSVLAVLENCEFVAGE